ncbi:MAG: antitoxin [Oligoflexia bacterium]|nr:antitoxin [Oligoflexia bacterium]
MKNKKKIKLTKEEQKLEDSFERDEWAYAGDKERDKLVKAAKDARLTIRISKDLVDKLREISAEEGVPYQTYITSSLHKLATGQLVEKKAIKAVIEAMKKVS